MVLNELGERISGALRKMANSTVIDQAAIDEMLKEICNALVNADVNFKLVLKLRENIRKRLSSDEVPEGLNRRRLVYGVVVDELCALLDSGVQPRKPVRGRSNVFMFVGLQGAGKTTTVSKLAYHYKKLGWKTALVCADTFRAGAYDQLKQNALKIRVPFYGSPTEADPVRAARDGAELFRGEGFEIIIVDTSGRHKQEAELFDEMVQVAAAVKPDTVIFLMDASIGQAAFDQASAFNQKVDVGAVVITKMDGHAKGGGALSAVAATRSPIIFIGTGEHMDDLEPFDSRSFVQKLLGMGDLPSLVQKIRDVVPTDNQQELVDRIKEGQFSLRDMYDQLQTIMKMGPLNKVMEMIPGMASFLNSPALKGVDSGARLKIYCVIMDSMTDKELDDPRVFEDKDKSRRDSRVMRIARGAGRKLSDVNELLAQYKQFQTMMKGLKNVKMGRNGQIQGRNMQQMAGMLPPNVVKNMGGAANIQQLLRSMSMPDK